MKSRKEILKKVLILLLAVLVLVPISGCWNRRELNNIGILGAIGIDIEGEKVIVTAEIIRPKNLGESGGSSKQSFVMEQTTGDSVFEALRNATEKFDRKIFLADCKIFIISEEAAKKGFVDCIDFWIRDHESRLYTYVYVVKEEKPSEVMGRSEGIEEIPSIYLQSLAKAQKANSKSISVELVDLIKEYYSIGKQPTCGVLQLSEIDQEKNQIENDIENNKNLGASQESKTDQEKKQSSNKDDQSAGKSDGKGSNSGSTDDTSKKNSIISGKEVPANDSKEILNEGAAVFRKDKLVGFLNGNETRAFNFVDNKIASGTIVAKAFGGVEVIEILKSKCKKEVLIQEDGKIQINVNVKITGSLGELTGDGIPLVKEKTDIDVQKIQELGSEVIKKEIEETISKTQKVYKSDIFGFGLEVHKKYPKEWAAVQEEWDQKFSEAQINVQVKTNIGQTGLLRLPTNVLKGKEIKSND